MLYYESGIVEIKFMFILHLFSFNSQSKKGKNPLKPAKKVVSSDDDLDDLLAALSSSSLESTPVKKPRLVKGREDLIKYVSSVIRAEYNSLLFGHQGSQNIFSKQLTTCILITLITSRYINNYRCI